MAHFVTTNGYVMINAVNLSDHCRSFTLDYKADPVDNTCFGDTSRVRLGGLKDCTLTAEFAQDFAASEVDATLFSLVGTVVAIKVRAVNTSIAATNPEFQFDGLVESYQPVKGAVGDLAVTTVTIQGSSGITRDVVA